MPNINITDSRNRDAVVKAESIRINESVRYVGPQSRRATTRKVLKATVNHDYDTLLAQHETPEALGAALVHGDPEVDTESFGTFLWNLSRVYINPKEEIVFKIEQREIVRDIEGNTIEERPRRHLEANVDSDIPLTWSGTIIPKRQAYRRFVFSSKLQIVHVNGLTYDFLYGISQELEKDNGLMLLGGGKSGKEPLVFRRGAVAYRGFLEGRTDGEKYILLLHLSNMELKKPEPAHDEGAGQTKATKSTDDAPEPEQPKQSKAKPTKKPVRKASKAADKEPAKEPVKKPAKKGTAKATKKPAKKPTKAKKADQQ